MFRNLLEGFFFSRFPSPCASLRVQRSFVYRAVKCWNMLPEEISKCESLHSFTSKAKSHFYTAFQINLLYFITFIVTFIYDLDFVAFYLLL